MAIQVRCRLHVPHASHLATVPLAAAGAEEEAVGGGRVARNVTDLDHRLHAGAVALEAEAEVRTGVEWTAAAAVVVAAAVVATTEAAMVVVAGAWGGGGGGGWEVAAWVTTTTMSLPHVIVILLVVMWS